MKASDIIISIIIPIYNTERYLKQCIESVLSQEKVSYELILVDDGSTDSCINIIKEYQNKYPQFIKGYFIKGKGPAEPRNYGLRHASGKYIYFLDSDDYLPYNALRNLLDAAETFPEADFIKGNHRVLTKDGEIRTRFSDSRKEHAGKLLDYEFALKHIIGGHNIPCNILYKHSFLKENNISFRENLTYLEDGPFLMELFSHHPKALYIDAETYVYRLGAEGSVTNTSLNASKVKSLIDGACVYYSLKNQFNNEGEAERQKMQTQYQLGALKGIAHLDKNESEDLFKYFISKIHAIDTRVTFGKEKIVAITYNISPRLAYWLLRVHN